MFHRSQNMVITKALADALLATLQAIPGAALINGAKLRLFKNNVVLGPLTAIADLTESTFTGYAATVLPALNGPITLAGFVEGLHIEVNFDCTAAPVPAETVFGYYVTDAAGAVLYAGETFGAPDPINNAGDFCSVDVIFAHTQITSTPT